MARVTGNPSGHGMCSPRECSMWCSSSKVQRFRNKECGNRECNLSQGRAAVRQTGGGSDDGGRVYGETRSSDECIELESYELRKVWTDRLKRRELCRLGGEDRYTIVVGVQSVLAKRMQSPPSVVLAFGMRSAKIHSRHRRRLGQNELSNSAIGGVGLGNEVSRCFTAGIGEVNYYCL